MSDKIKPIILTDTENGDKFTLEFSRESVKWAEMHGFVLDDVEKYPMTKIPELFYYAFRMHHKNIARNKTDKIFFEDLGGISSAIVERLGLLYAAPFDSLIGDDEDEPKNAKMTVEM